VSILETYAPGVGDPVRGLARIVQVSPKLSIVDLSVRGLSPGKYYASVRENGDISQGAVSTGRVWQGAVDSSEEPLGRFGEFETDKSGAGKLFVTRPVEIWELIGRSFVVSKKETGFATNEPDTLCGVIARSAGVWENEKTVCIQPQALPRSMWIRSS
jgi:copper chaperone for superoxide dismutase